MQSLVAGLTLYCIAIGMVQLAFLLGLGWSESRRVRRAPPLPDWPPAAVFAIVPCLNEELVIGETVRALLLQDPRIRVVVIDDGSDDDTSGRAVAAGGDRVTVLRRELPRARLGKGPALNHAYDRISEIVEQESLPADRVIIMVMDADGRLSPGAVDEVVRLFGDPKVGGAQLGVRIRNRRANQLTAIQDCEFWGIAALGQLGRMRTRTVSLGGNGQFTRLTALQSIGAEPWSPALTEDLDLAVTLSIGGWHLTSTPTSWVSQQGLVQVRPLIKQRTRWFQGHMTTAIERLGDVWRSRHLSNAAVLEMSSYLLIPFAIVLPWSILSQVGLYAMVRNASTAGVPTADTGLPGPAWLLPVLVWYVLSFAPTVLCGLIYSRREKDISLIRAVAFSHLLVLWNYVLFVSCWAAVIRMLRGRTGWVKTVRLDEAARSAPSRRPAPAEVTAPVLAGAPVRKGA